MAILTISSPMKTRQPRQLCQLKGKIRLGVKADPLHCLESDLPENHCSAPVSDAIILDGAVVVKMLSPGRSKTFQEYGEMVSYIHDQLKKSNRIDRVCDVYLPAS